MRSLNLTFILLFIGVDASAQLKSIVKPEQKISVGLDTLISNSFFYFDLKVDDQVIPAEETVVIPYTIVNAPKGMNGAWIGNYLGQQVTGYAETIFTLEAPPNENSVKIHIHNPDPNSGIRIKNLTIRIFVSALTR